MRAVRTYFFVDERFRDKKVSFQCENDCGGKGIEISEGEKSRQDFVLLFTSFLVLVRFGMIK